MLKTKVGAWIVGGALILGSGVALAGEGALETADEPVLESAATTAETETTKTEAETDPEKSGSTTTDEVVTDPVEGAVDELEETTETGEEAKDNHGALVSKAAHCEVPDGYANRGKFVSAVAHGNEDAVGKVDGCTPKHEDKADDGEDAADAADESEEKLDQADKKQNKPAKAQKQGKSGGAGKGRGGKK